MSNMDRGTIEGLITQLNSVNGISSTEADQFKQTFVTTLQTYLRVFDTFQKTQEEISRVEEDDSALNDKLKEWEKLYNDMLQSFKP